MMYILRISGTSDNQNDYWKSWWHVFKTKEEADDGVRQLRDDGIDSEVIRVYEEQEYKNLENVLKTYDCYDMLITERNELQVHNQILQNHLKIAIDMLACWCIAVEKDSSWDGWDECYKDAAYRDGPLRTMLDKAIADAREIFQ